MNSIFSFDLSPFLSVSGSPSVQPSSILFDSLFGSPLLWLPELYLVFFLSVLFALGSFFPFISPKLSPVTRPSFSGTAILSLFFFFLLGFGSLAGPTQKVFFNYSFYDDSSVLFFKLFLTLVFFSYFFSISYSSFKDRFHAFEFPLLFLFSFLGMYLMLSCYDLLLFYLVLELQSFCFYILSAFRKNSPHSTEAGLKYFIMGALSSSFLLFGISIIYLFTSTTTLGPLHFLTVFASPFQHLPFIFGLLLVLTGLFFKLSFAPFHFWTPDVYDGSPLSVTSFYLIISKVPVFFFLFRFLFVCLEGFSPYPLLETDGFFLLPSPYYFIVFPSLFSLFVGSFGAIYQVRIKRFFAYTSIAHTGYLGLALASGVESFFFYLFAYTLTNLAVFSLFSNLRFRTREGEFKLTLFKELPPLANTFPYLTIFLALGLFSMAGIPPLVGFLSKYYVILSLLSVGLYVALFALLFFSVFSTYYYLKTIRFLFFSDFSSWAFFCTPPVIPLGIGFIFSLFFCLAFVSADLFFLPFKFFYYGLYGSVGLGEVSSPIIEAYPNIIK